MEHIKVGQIQAKVFNEFNEKSLFFKKEDKKIFNAVNIVKEFDIEGVGRSIGKVLNKDRFKHL